MNRRRPGTLHIETTPNRVADAIAMQCLVPRLAGVGDDRFPGRRSAPSPMDEALWLRLTAAYRTPSGWPQPPELAGVTGSVRVPNSLQPMTGEFASGHEVGDGQPKFFPFANSRPPILTSGGVIPPALNAHRRPLHPAAVPRRPDAGRHPSEGRRR